MKIIDKLKMNNPGYKAGYLNPWCVSCGALGPQFPTQQFIEIGCEYHCSPCVDAGKTNYDAAPIGILENNLINIVLQGRGNAYARKI